MIYFYCRSPIRWHTLERLGLGLLIKKQLVASSPITTTVTLHSPQYNYYTIYLLLVQVLIWLWLKVSHFLNTWMPLKWSHIVWMSLLPLSASPLYSFTSFLVTICGAAGGVLSHHRRTVSHYTPKEERLQLSNSKGKQTEHRLLGTAHRQ